MKHTTLFKDASLASWLEKQKMIQDKIREVCLKYGNALEVKIK